MNNWTLGPGHLGDAVWSLTALRHIDAPHTFYCPVEYHRNLEAICEDRDIKLMPMDQATADARCTWIGNMRFAHKGVAWAMQRDVLGFLCAWSSELALEAGQPKMFVKHDLLCDWPAINRPVHDVPEFDALVINARPLSGQCPRWDEGEMDQLIAQIAVKNRVVCTNQTTASGPNITVVDKTISEIGSLSLRAQFIVAVSTGAAVCVHNVFDRTIPTFIFLDDPLKILWDDKEIVQHGLVLQGMLPELQSHNLI
ncbi:MAG: hypothetical protein WBD81_17945 [Collimonas pratensis]|uniref:hypothetical protein n=1 Tax=Collimonas pratensis TaxID=279113 RepID=UPI003C72CEF8